MDIRNITFQDYCHLSTEQRGAVNAQATLLQEQIASLFFQKRYTEMVPLIEQLPAYTEPHKSQYLEQVLRTIQQVERVNRQQALVDALKKELGL